MSIHPKLTGFRKAKHIKAFRSVLKSVEKDLHKLGVSDFDVEITSNKSSKSLLRRFLDSGYGDTEEILEIFAKVEGCTVEIIVPMAKGGIAPPYLVDILIPVPMTGRAEFRRGLLGNKWYLEPENKNRRTDLKKTIPKVKMVQRSVSRKLPIQGNWDIEIGHSLETDESGYTRWVIQSGYEGGLLSGGNRPKIIKYFEVIPEVLIMLRKWQEQG